MIFRASLQPPDSELEEAARARLPDLAASIWEPSFIPVLFSGLFLAAPDPPRSLTATPPPGNAHLSDVATDQPLPLELLLFSLFYLEETQVQGVHILVQKPFC